MKRVLTAVLCFIALNVGFSQSTEATQLLLNYEKLQQLEKILDNMYKGYTILSKGYNTIKNISEGNYTLHDLFLSRLLSVNPLIRDYKRVAGIITYQQFIMKDYKRAWNRFRNDSNLTLQEIAYIERVYANLVQSSLHNLDDLLTVITAAELRMSDDERISAIDRIFLDMEGKVSFLKQFNNSTSSLLVKRARERQDVQSIQKLHNVNP
jgi:hypothetical protein